MPLDHKPAPKTLPFMTRARYAAALISTGILNLGGLGVFFRSACTPGFYCHGCPWATFACPIGVMAFGSAVRAIPVFAVGFVLAVGALLGRLVCSFLCPFGLLQDLLYKIPGPKIRLPGWTRYIKYAALVLLVFFFPALLGFRTYGFVVVRETRTVPAADGKTTVLVSVSNPSPETVSEPEVDLVYRDSGGNELLRRTERFDGVSVKPGGTEVLTVFDMPEPPEGTEVVAVSPQSRIRQDPWYGLYYCKICPAGTLTATIPAYLGAAAEAPGAMLGRVWLRLAILVFFLVLMVFSSRPFCRTFCPLGAIYALTSRFAVTGIGVDRSKCIECGACYDVCPVGLNPSREAGVAECISCGDCIAVCPTGAISRRFGLK